MNMKLNSQKVITEIEGLKSELKNRLSKKEDFEDIHKQVLRLCKIIFSVKKDYKLIDIEYPSSIVIIFDDALMGEGSKTNRTQIPSNRSIWEQKMNLGNDILSILDNIYKTFALKLKLQMDK